jgi:WD40 repeat protein
VGRRRGDLVDEGVDEGGSEGGLAREVLARGCADGTVRLWEVATGRELQVLALDDEVRALAFSPDGALLVTGCTTTAMT